MTVLLSVALVLTVGLLSIVAAGAVLGTIGALMGGAVQRCPRCGRVGLAARGEVHPTGCPSPATHVARRI